MGAPGTEEWGGDSQFACHDHLGLVRVDGAALLEQVDGCFVGIYKQDALPENVQIDKLACQSTTTGVNSWITLCHGRRSLREVEARAERKVGRD